MGVLWQHITPSMIYTIRKLWRTSLLLPTDSRMSFPAHRFSLLFLAALSPIALVFPSLNVSFVFALYYHPKSTVPLSFSQNVTL